MKRLTVAMVLLFSALLCAGEYGIDFSHSHVGFKVKHMMVSSVSGKFDRYDGMFELRDGKVTKLEGVVETRSINTDNEKRDNHLRSADFFDAAKYPEMMMKLIAVDGDEAVVDLTIKGITKRVTMELEMGGEIDDPWGNRRAGLELEGKIDRKDFGLTWNKILESGGLLVGDQVKIMIALEGIEK